MPQATQQIYWVPGREDTKYENCLPVAGRIMSVTLGLKDTRVMIAHSDPESRDPAGEAKRSGEFYFTELNYGTKGVDALKALSRDLGKDGIEGLVDTNVCAYLVPVNPKSVTVAGISSITDHVHEALMKKLRPNTP